MVFQDVIVEIEMKLRDAMGLVAGLRSLLSVAWAQQALDDETFQKLEQAYEALGGKISPIICASSYFPIFTVSLDYISVFPA